MQLDALLLDLVSECPLGHPDELEFLVPVQWQVVSAQLFQGLPVDCDRLAIGGMLGLFFEVGLDKKCQKNHSFT